MPVFIICIIIYCHFGHLAVSGCLGITHLLIWELRARSELLYISSYLRHLALSFITSGLYSILKCDMDWITCIIFIMICTTLFCLNMWLREKSQQNSKAKDRIDWSIFSVQIFTVSFYIAFGAISSFPTLAGWLVHAVFLWSWSWSWSRSRSRYDV